MLRVGLTGGIACGKSAVAGEFSRLGIPVLDADKIARELCEPGQPGLTSLSDTLGSWLLDKSGRLDRASLRTAIFKDSRLRERVEAILHPLILERMQILISGQDAPYCILEIPLLARSRPARAMTDQILVVDCTMDIQLQRLQERDGCSRDAALAIIHAQTGRQENLAIADQVIVNDGDRAAIPATVKMLDDTYRKLAAAHQHET